MTHQEVVQKTKQKREVKPVQPEPLKPIALNLKQYQRDALRRIVRILKALDIEEATFRWNGDLRVRQMNSARVALVDATLTFRQGLDASQPLSKDIRTFTVNVAQLNSALRIQEPTIEVLEDRAYVSGKISYDRYSAKVKLPLFEDEEEVPPDMNVKFEVATELNIADIMTHTEKLLADPVKHLRFANEKGKLQIFAANDFQDIDLDVKHKCTGPDATAKYSATILSALGKGDWNIAFSQDMPLKVSGSETHKEYEYEGSTPKSRTVAVAQITVYVAPRIESA